MGRANLELLGLQYIVRTRTSFLALQHSRKTSIVADAADARCEVTFGLRHVALHASGPRSSATRK